MAGLSRIHARLRYLGLPLLRLHSDRAGELRSKILRKWAEDRKVLRTYTDGDSFKSNGRTESAIGLLKRHIRVLLKETGQPPSMWPLAARHAAERKHRQQLAGFGLPVGQLLPYGCTAYARQKIWNEKYQDWKLSRRPVTVLGPDVAMSASMAGYYVKGEDGKFFHSSDVTRAEGPPPEAIEDQPGERPELGPLREPGQRMRIYGKTPMLSSLQVPVEEAEHRRLRGLKLLMEELEINDYKTEEELGNDVFIRALLKDVEELASSLEEEGKTLEEENLGGIEAAALSQEVFLQTRSYSLADVRADLESWKPSMMSEFTALTEETGAIRVITEEEAERLRKDAEKRGILFERIPGKAIFSRKAGSGKRKCRACACGNYMSQRALTDTYAGGTGATEVRCLLRKGALEQWAAVTLDVKTAFLRAPRDHSREIVVVQPPQIFFLAGIAAPGTLWLVDRALYGLTTSPKEWTQFRNEKVSTFTWESDGHHYAVEKTGDQDIWKIVCQNPVHRCEGPRGEGPWTASTEGCVAGCGIPSRLGDRSDTTPGVAGYFVTYVDDVLAIGDEKVLKGFCDRVAQEWEIGTPEWVIDGGAPVRFLGMELEKRGTKYRLHQESFIQSLLEKYPGERGVGLSHVKVPEDEPKPEAHLVREAQKQTGELLWISGRTRPDVAYAINVMSQHAAKRPRGVINIAKEVRAYLRTCPGLALEYEPVMDGDFGVGKTQRRSRHSGLVEVYTDASFASSEMRSTTGVVGCYAGAPVFWYTGRQSF
eukprot:s34_g8.t1